MTHPLRPGLMISAAFLFLGLVGERTSHAAQYKTCNGNLVGWTSPPEFVRNTCSIPYGGARWNSYANALNRWNGIGAMQNILQDNGDITTYCFPDTYDIENLDNGFNDVLVVDPSQIPDGSGKALIHYTLCVLDQSITEVDVFVSEAHDMGQPEPIITSSGGGKGKGRETFMHEFGHALGLMHSSALNMMRNGGGYGNGFLRFGGGGERIDAAPDDALGGRTLYPAIGVERNIFSTSQRHVQGTQFPFGTVILNADGTTAETNHDVCASTGGTFQIDFTGGNNGNTNVTHNVKAYISVQKEGWSGVGVPVFSWNGGTYNTNGVYYSKHWITIPQMPTGTYYLYFFVDSDDGTNESREDDNIARSSHRFTVKSC